MRRSTSALTTTILGAALSVSTVSAQQSQTSRSASASATAAAAQDADAGFGMTAARGARHLLRNGLDYIDYQEFDRALKYLREAEKRQAELNGPERTRLQQALERAQRGTREAIGSEKPYARSGRTLRPGGFAPAAAQPETVTASNSTRSQQAGKTREGDDRAEPIQLAGAEAPAPLSSRTRSAGAPASLPEIPDSPLIEFPSVESAAPTAVATVARFDVEDDDVPVTPTPPTVNRITSTATTAALDAEADLLAPFPPLDPTPALDSAVARSAEERPASSTAAPAPITIELELPDELPTPASLAPVAPAPRVEEAIPTLDPAPIADPSELDLDELDDAADLLDLDAPAPVAPLQPPPAPVFEERQAPPAVARTPVMETFADPAPDADALLDDPNLDLPALPAGLLQNDAASMVETVELPDDDQPMEADLPLLPEEDVADEYARPAMQPEPRGLPAAADDAFLDDSILEDDLLEDEEDLPTLPQEVAPAYSNRNANLEPDDELPAPADVEEDVIAAPEFTPTPVPAEAPALGDGFLPERGMPRTILSPELERRVEQLAQRQEDEARDRIARQTNSEMQGERFNGEDQDLDLDSDFRTQTQIDISRAPSPAEARPIAAIPVPEDFVPLGARTWSAQRKYWAAAATCHMPLYFQDPMLERYGHSVENYLGPKGRYFTYPVDDPTQSTQRVQVAQPFASVGMFAFQLLTLPYALVVDPPWEAQYDLGYWRPGDKIPTDMYYLPLRGTGPPLKGKNY